MEVKEIEGTSLSYRTGDSGGNCWFSIENIPAEIKEKLPHDIKIQYDGFTSEVEAGICARANGREIKRIMNQ